MVQMEFVPVMHPYVMVDVTIPRRTWSRCASKEWN